MYSCSCCLWNISHFWCILLLHGLIDLEICQFTWIFEWKKQFKCNMTSSLMRSMLCVHTSKIIIDKYVHDNTKLRCQHTADVLVMQATYIVEYEATIVLNRSFTHCGSRIMLKRSTFIGTLHQHTDCL